jgi:putative endonuclease
MREYCVYILASQKRGTLYIGVTDDLIRRIWEHKLKVKDGFTKKYGVDKLVHYEATDDIGAALQREKSLKKWRRWWKINLIEETNPEWRDLFYDLVDEQWMEENRNMFKCYDEKIR